MTIEALAGEWIVPQWDVPCSVRAFVTTRFHPQVRGTEFDTGPADPDTLDPDRRAVVVANRAFLASRLPSAPVWLEQTHGRDVACIDEKTIEAARLVPPVADAAVTRLVDVPLAIRVADCLPVFLGDNDGSVVAAAHAGWRGLAAGVLEATVDAMGVPPSTLRAWLGPAIGAQAFEVGGDVVDAFLHYDRDARSCFTPGREGKWMADLQALARRRLAACGVDRVHGADACTWSDASRFFSWRRDRTPQRMAALLWRASPQA